MTSYEIASLVIPDVLGGSAREREYQRLTVLMLKEIAYQLALANESRLALPDFEGTQAPTEAPSTRPSPCTCVNSGALHCPVHPGRTPVHVDDPDLY